MKTEQTFQGLNSRALNLLKLDGRRSKGQGNQPKVPTEKPTKKKSAKK